MAKSDKGCSEDGPIVQKLMAAEDSTPPWVLVARILFSFCSVVVLVAAIPSLGSVTLADRRIGYGWRDVVSLSIILTPLIVMMLGAVFSRYVEYVGWLLALGLLVSLFA